MEGMTEQLPEILRLASGFIYPNEAELHWGFLVVIYPYLTGLVAGAFILASLVKVFNVKALLPTYRLSMLTALSFLIVAPLPLLAHLGHPERSLQIFLTPQPKSAMAMFGFVYAWYLMMVLLAEIWLEYRIVLIEKGRTKKGLKKLFYKIVSLWDTDISKKSVIFDHKAIHFITLVGIPSAFLLHGYVGFIFGAIKANPWWSSVLMPVVFLFSAIVSGIALVLILYTLTSLFKSRPLDMKCLEKLAAFLLYALLVDFSLEMLDFIHRLYESEESIEILGHMITNRLFISLIIVQMLLGTIIPLITLSILHIKKDLPVELRRLGYLVAAILIQMGIFSTRWNVVVGGQLFSKSLRGLTIYKIEMLGTEGLFMGLFLLILPFIILYVVAKILPMWQDDPVAE